MSRPARQQLQMILSLFLQGNITGLTGTMDFKDGGSNSHVQFEILGSSFSETFGKDIKRVSSQRFTSTHELANKMVPRRHRQSVSNPKSCSLIF